MKNKILLFAFCLGLFALSVHSCDKIYDPINIRGKVIDQDTSQPVSNANVSIISPEDLAAQTISNESGEYLFEEVDVDSVIDVTIQVAREGFSTESITVLAAPERELVVPDIKIRDLQADENGNGFEPGTGSGAAEIQLNDIESYTINIAESGGGATSAFSFVVLDSTGVPLGPESAVDVEFRITEGPGGAEHISPSTVRTNENGMVTSTIFAGNIAGNMKIEAKIERPEHNLTIRSSPIALTIHGGFPNLDHFSIGLVESSPYNIPSYLLDYRSQIKVILGDKFSNPVKPQTPVYFNTNGGVIQGSGETDSDGIVIVDHISANPFPPDGYATIKAHSFDENENQLSREVLLLFSTNPTFDNINLSPSNLNFSPEQSRIYTVTVTDTNGNPLPYNTEVSIEPSNGITINEESFSVGNSLTGGENITDFEFTATASDEFSGAASFRVVVTAPSLNPVSRRFP